jgi:hypothetical protein
MGLGSASTASGTFTTGIAESLPLPREKYGIQMTHDQSAQAAMEASNSLMTQVHDDQCSGIKVRQTDIIIRKDDTIRRVAVIDQRPGRATIDRTIMRARLTEPIPLLLGEYVPSQRLDVAVVGRALHTEMAW